jgi:hypothetical protein
MADNGAQTLEGTEEKVENTPPPMEGKETVVSPKAAVEPPAPSGEERAAEPPAPTGDQDTIRSVFVARTAASSAASVGGFAQMETTDDGLAVRGAYRARLAVVEAEVVAAAPPAENDVLRKAYLAHAVAEMAAQPRPAKRSAAGKQKKAPPAKPKQRAARASSAKPKKFSVAGAKSKPQTAVRRAAAARRGKRRGR